MNIITNSEIKLDKISISMDETHHLMRKYLNQS